MTSSRKSKRNGAATARGGVCDEFKHEALALAERGGVADAAGQLDLSSSPLYGWRQKAQPVKARGQFDQEQTREIARHKG